MIHIDPRERNFIIATVVLLVIFATAVGISGFAMGIQVPLPSERVNPQEIFRAESDSPFALPVEERVRELAPGRYEVYMTAQAWQFSPDGLREEADLLTFPVGSTVTFRVTSKDVQHGFRINETNLNMQVLPGDVSVLSATFDEPGVYPIVCHEYCGQLHHNMYGQITVVEN
jgi:cytochrome c oxidase subunit 2